MKWGGDGEETGRERGGEVSLQATWDQGGRDCTTQKEGFQVSKGNLRKGKNWQGEMAKGNQQGE
jgi:hypothetical protein